MRQLIFLTGMPGCGKTFYGKRWSKEYNWQFLDLDEAIEAENRASVHELFQTRGEPYFRQRETGMLQVITALPGRIIVATGGGTPAYNNNLDLMLQTGCVVYIRADRQTLYNRLTGGTEKRPLLREETLMAQLDQLLADRKQYYEQAHMILDEQNISSFTFEEILSACTNRH